MIDWTWFASVAAFALSMSATPGPNNAMLMSSGATWGFSRSLPHLLGVALGFPAMMAAVALGAGELLRAAPSLQVGLRWVGAAYLLWLAVHIARARPTLPGNTGSGRPLSFPRAALFQWVNPKAWVICMGAAVTYLTASGHTRLVQAVVLLAVFLLVTLACTAAWTVAGVAAARLLRSEAALRGLNLAMAALLVASLVPLFME